MASPLNIAIIGSGIGGLSAAWCLGPHHNVTIIEKEATLGMDCRGVDVGGERLDTPPRSFNPAYYPNLWQLYRHAGVEVEPLCWDMSFNIEGQDRSIVVAKRVGWLGRLPIIFRGSFWPTELLAAVRCSRDWSKLLSGGVAHLTDPATHNQTLEEYLEQQGPFSKDFVEGVLLPMMATFLTASFQAVLKYPAVLILEFLISHGLGDHYHTRHGSQHAAQSLATRAATVRLNTAVTAIWPSTAMQEEPGTDRSGSDAKQPSGTQQQQQQQQEPVSTPRHKVLLQLRTQSQQGSEITTKDELLEFDHVIIATQADQALQLLTAGLKGGAAATQAVASRVAALGSIPHEWSEMVIHTDERLLPPCRHDRQAANFTTSTDRTTAAGTILMACHTAASAARSPASLPPEPASMPSPSASAPAASSSSSSSSSSSAPVVLQTWNPLPALQPQPEAVLSKYRFQRPLVTVGAGGSAEAVAELWRAQGLGGVWLAGAYSLLTVPLQESAVSSGVRVAAALGCPAPWLSPRTAAAPLQVPTSMAEVGVMAADRLSCFSSSSEGCSSRLSCVATATAAAGDGDLRVITAAANYNGSSLARGEQGSGRDCAGDGAGGGGAGSSGRWSRQQQRATCVAATATAVAVAASLAASMARSRVHHG